VVTGVTTDFTPFLFCARARAIRGGTRATRAPAPAAPAPPRASGKSRNPKRRKVQGETRHLSHDAPTLTQRNSLSLWSWGGVYFYSVFFC